MKRSKRAPLRHPQRTARASNDRHIGLIHRRVAGRHSGLVRQPTVTLVPACVMAMFPPPPVPREPFANPDIATNRRMEAVHARLHILPIAIPHAFVVIVCDTCPPRAPARGAQIFTANKRMIVRRPKWPLIQIPRMTWQKRMRRMSWSAGVEIDRGPAATLGKSRGTGKMVRPGTACQMLTPPLLQSTR